MANQQRSEIEHLLGCGRFQGLTFLCYQWVVCLQAWNMVFMVFGKAMPKTWAYNNNNYSASLNDSRPPLTGCECRQSEFGCSNFTWSGDFYSLVPHWELVCDRVKIIYLIMTIQMMGVLVGSPVFGQISDSFGRKWTLFSAVAVTILFGALSAISPNWKVFAGLRFLVGMGCSGTTTTVMVLLMEMLSQRHRLWVNAIAGWPVAYMMLSAMAYVMRDWRTLAIVTNLAGLPALILIMVVGESPRWLVQKGKRTRARAQLHRIGRINGTGGVDEKEMVAVLDQGGSPQRPAVADHGQQKKKYTYWHLFSSRSMATHTVVFAACHFCTSTVSNGVLFNVDRLSGNIFLNFFIFSCLRWFSNSLTIVVDIVWSKFGRKLGTVIPYCLIAICSLSVVVLYVAGQSLSDVRTIISVLSLAIAMICSPIWVIMHLSTSENYPTPIRSIAAAFCAAFTRIGSTVMPQFLYLGHFWAPAPFVVFTAFSSTAGLLFGLFIPETKGHPLPDSITTSTTTARRESLALYEAVAASNEGEPVVVSPITTDHDVDDDDDDHNKQ